MKTKVFNKLMSVIFCLALLITIIPTTVLAAPVAGEDPYVNRYGYSQLSEVEKDIYNKMIDGLKKKQTEIALGNVTNDQVSHVFNVIIKDSPELYYLTGGYDATFGGGVFKVKPGYLKDDTGADYKFDDALFEQKVTELLKAAEGKYTEYDKALALHDALVKHIQYDKAALSTFNAISHTAYGALVHGLCVCEGYAEAYQLLLERLGIQSYAVSGVAKSTTFENHEWNLVRLDGKYYYVDVTWDDPLGKNLDTPDKPIYHGYFAVSANDIGVDHIPGAENEGGQIVHKELEVPLPQETYTKLHPDLVRIDDISAANRDNAIALAAKAAKLVENQGVVRVYYNPTDPNAPSMNDWLGANWKDISNSAAVKFISGTYGFRSSGPEYVYYYDADATQTVNYTLTTSVPNGNGSVTANATYEHGTTANIIFAPNSGFVVDTVTVNGIEVLVENNVLNLVMDGNKDLVVTFKEDVNAELNAAKAELKAAIDSMANADLNAFTRATAAAFVTARDAATKVYNESNDVAAVRKSKVDYEAAVSALLPKMTSVRECLSYQQTVEVSGTSNFVPQNIVDGTDEGRWDSGYNISKGNNIKQGTEWVIIHLGEGTSLIEEVQIKFFNLVFPTDYDILVSTDKQNWVTVKAGRGFQDGGAANPVDTITFDTPVAAKYIKFNFKKLNASAAGNGIGITEASVNGKRLYENADVNTTVNPADLTVNKGITVEELRTKLTTLVNTNAQVHATPDGYLADELPVQVPVNWDLTGFDGSLDKEWTFTGTVANMGTVNGNNKTVTVKVIVGNPHTHVYNATGWAWTDYSSATVTLQCTKCDHHVTQTVTGNAITHETTKPATCTEVGTERYTATVVYEGATFTGTKDKKIPAKGHTYGEPTWKWNGNTNATATFTCGTCNHPETVTVTENNGITSNTTPSTCTVAGKTVYTATVTFNEGTYTNQTEVTLDLLPHSYGQDYKSDATNHWHECTCGDKSGITKHTFKEIIDVEATETTQGKKHSECEECGYATAQVDIPVKPHVHANNLTFNAGKDATEFEAGYKGHYTCSCGKMFADETATKEITDLAAWRAGEGKLDMTHTHTYGAAEWTWNADHTTATVTFKCTKTNCTHEEVVKANITSQTTDATCTAKGNTTYTAKATFNNQEYTDVQIVEIPMKEHIYGQGYKSNETQHWYECTCGAKSGLTEHTFKEIIDVEATETTQGKKHSVCKVCGYTTAQVDTPVKPHVHANNLTFNAGKDATEFEAGYKGHYTCSCGKMFADETATKEITDLAAWRAGEGKLDMTHQHTFGTEWKKDENGHWHECTCSARTDEATHTFKDVIEKDPTDLEVGLKHQECTVCGYITKTVEIDKLEHIHNNLELVKGKAATTTEAGWKDYYKCRCGQYFEDQQGTKLIQDLEAWKLGAGKIDVHKHAFTEVVEHKNATCDAVGYDIKKCACGETVRIEIPKLTGAQCEVPTTPTVDKKELSEYVTNHENYKDSDYTADSYSKYRIALREAKRLISDDKATQKDVDKAYNNLKLAVEGLVKKDEVKPTPTPSTPKPTDKPETTPKPTVKPTEKPTVKPTVKPEPTKKPVANGNGGYDDGGPFTTDECGSVYDRWGNLMWKAPTCKAQANDGYRPVNTSDR